MANITITQILMIAIPLIFAITLHEVAHGYAALQFGDRTAQIMGRLTLNPFKHLDPIGTVAVPLLLLFFGGIMFGWAKPVPVNPRNFKGNKKLANIVVAGVGPLANLMMAIFWALIMKISYTSALTTGSQFWLFILHMGQFGIQFNVILMVLNLIPIPPLDGSRIVANLLPPKMAYKYDKIEPYGFIIIVILLFTGILANILIPPVYFINNLLLSMLVM